MAARLLSWSDQRGLWLHGDDHDHQQGTCDVVAARYVCARK
jgi:hypothetical protein